MAAHERPTPTYTSLQPGYLSHNCTQATILLLRLMRDAASGLRSWEVPCAAIETAWHAEQETSSATTTIAWEPPATRVSGEAMQAHGRCPLLPTTQHWSLARPYRLADWCHQPDSRPFFCHNAPMQRQQFAERQLTRCICLVRRCPKCQGG